MDELKEMKGTLLTAASHPNEEWPQLIPLDEYNLPRLNLDNIPGWAGDYARALSDDTETPPELAIAMILATCSTAAARSYKVLVQPGYYEPCNLWIIAALPSGSRKSAVQSKATAPLGMWEYEQARVIEPEIKRLTSERKTIEARIKEVRIRASKEKNAITAAELSQEATALEIGLPIIPGYPQLWMSDFTPEKLGTSFMEHNECMACLSSEGGLFDSFGRYTNGIPNLDLILKSHSGDSEKITRQSRGPVSLRNPLLTIGLSPQPIILTGLASNPKFRGCGLLARFLYLLPPSLLGHRTLDSRPIPENISRAYATGIQAMLNWPCAVDENSEKTSHIVHLTQDAYKLYKAFARSIETQLKSGGTLEHLTDWGSKASGAVIRVAGILHGVLHTEGKKPWEEKISAETMTNALEIMIVIMEHCLAAFNLMGADPTIDSARYVLEWIKNNKLTRFSINDAFNALRRFKRVADLKKALQVLEERNYIMVEDPVVKPGKGRRGSQIVRVNPTLQEQ